MGRASQVFAMLSGLVSATPDDIARATHEFDAGDVAAAAAKQALGGGSLPAGGTTGEVLTKASDADGDADWEPGGGALPDPVTDTVTISPDTDEAALVITTHPGSGQTTLPFQVYDEDGDLAVDIDSQGVLDTRHIAVQDPPDVGGGPGAGSLELSAGHIVANDDGTHNALEVWDTSVNNAVLLIKGGGHGDILEISPTVNTDVPVQIIQALAPAANQIEIWDNAFNTLLYAISKGGGVIFPAADPHVAGAWWDNAGTLTRSAG